MANRIQKYINRIGQKTGISNILKKLHTNAITVAFVAEYLFECQQQQSKLSVPFLSFSALHHPNVPELELW